MLVNIMGIIDILAGLVLLQDGGFASIVASILLVKGGISLVSTEMG
jgi:uncharacterized membrane protein HdeD (DUF308 family)